MARGQVVIGVIYLVVAVANLFVDFSSVENAEAKGFRRGRRYAGLSIMLALANGLHRNASDSRREGARSLQALPEDMRSFGIERA